MLTHARAAIVAARSTAAPPVSVRRNSRSGVGTLRTQAVRLENPPSVVAGVLTRYRRRLRRAFRWRGASRKPSA